MIIINKFGLLKYKNLKFRCALGKAGIGEKKSEGDKITPRGTYKIVRIYYRNQANKITVLIGSSSGASVTIDVTDTLSFNKIAISYKVNDVRVFVNGSLEGTITSVAMPVGLNELALDVANNLPFYGKVKQLQVYDTALTDTELATLTTI